MSLDDRDDDRDETRKDSKLPLTQREVFELYLSDPVLRPLVLGALGGLAMVFLVMFLGRSDIGAVVVTLYGLAILAFRWTAGPPVLLLVLFYFQVFPFGYPETLYDSPAYFRMTDAILVMALLVYLRCLYRVLGVVQQSMPFESVFRRKGEHPTRRPTSHIAPEEIAWLLGAAALLVILGQAAWWLVNAIEFVPTDPDFPLRWVNPKSLGRYQRSRTPPGEFAPGASRFFVMLGAMFFGLLFVRLVFGYWRLRMMNAAEGAMVLTDTSWAESHRERVRVEKWRIWGRQRAAEGAKKQAREERERRHKQEDAREGRRKIDAHIEEAIESRPARARRKERDEQADDDRPRRGR